MTTVNPLQTQINSVIALYSNGQIEEALDSVGALIKDYPNEAILYNISGACYASLGQLDTAVKQYDKAIAMKPDSLRRTITSVAPFKNLVSWMLRLKAMNKHSYLNRTTQMHVITLVLHSKNSVNWMLQLRAMSRHLRSSLTSLMHVITSASLSRNSVNWMQQLKTTRRQ